MSVPLALVVLSLVPILSVPMFSVGNWAAMRMTFHNLVTKGLF